MANIPKTATVDIDEMRRLKNNSTWYLLNIAIKNMYADYVDFFDCNEEKIATITDMQSANENNLFEHTINHIKVLNSDCYCSKCGLFCMCVTTIKNVMCKTKFIRIWDTQGASHRINIR